MTASNDVRKIVAEFRKIEQDDPQPDGPKKWTEKVLATLCELGRELDCKVYASGVPGAGIEWLYDVTWCKCHKSHGRLLSVPLVAECEWGNWKAIAYDFEKLLLSRAAVRVMVYGWHDTEWINEELRKHVCTFNGEHGDTYLLVSIVWDGSKGANRFEFAQIVYRGSDTNMEGIA